MNNSKSFLYFNKIINNHLIVMTTRTGGYSTGAFDSFNMGINTGDDLSIIEKNFQLLKDTHNITNLVTLNQVHSNTVHKVNSNNIDKINQIDGDGLFTTDDNIALGIFTADCYPLVFIGEKAISVIHLGWRGLNSGTIEQSIKLFKDIGDYPKHAFIGVGISKEFYEVGEDMISEWNKDYDVNSALEKGRDNSYKLDLRRLIKNVLKLNNINEYEFLDGCTYKDDDKFFSYRRDNGVTGRHLTVVMKGYSNE